MNSAPTNEYRPMGAWGYVGYQLLFAIPLLGFIFLIVFALDSSYIARRNFARSFFCIMILSIIILIAFMAPMLAFFETITSNLS